MAGEPWNRVSVPFPSAVSCVRVRFRPTTDLIVKTLLGENEKVLKILGSEILQTEIRVLYELMYVLNNSFRGNKTYKGLQQVEQCINRLKSMKLDSALQELTELCPNRIQRGLSLMAGECDVPSQPKLEWLCLKVLGAAQLMSCTLNRCSRAFLLSKRQMKWEEYVILNVVITSMLSRLWVMFRGVLVCLSALYEQLLNFLREVALAQPMPFLTDFSLPADLAELLGPSDAVLLSRPSAHSSQQRSKISSVKVKNQGQRGKVKQDLGTAVERGTVNDADMKPFLRIFRNFTEAKPVPKETRKKPKFKKQVREASTFTDMATHLEEMIQWCKSQKLKKEKRLLTFLLLKCQRMKCVEAAGYNIQRKLETFRQEACWASSPQGSVPRTCRSTASFRRNACRRTRFHKLRNHFKILALRTLKTHRKTRMTELSVSGLSEDEQSNTSTHTATSQAADCHSHDEIDDIFASIGL